VDNLHIDCSRIKELNPPYIIKPTFLAGSECVYFARDEDEALQYARRVVKCDPSGRALIQEYVSGIHGSISVIYGRGGYLLYSLNLQLIILDGSRLRYVGGVLPIRNHVFRRRAEIVLSKLYESFPELRGYIGLDVVWGRDDMYVIEVNPRATTSIIGIYEIFSRLGEFLIKSVSIRRDVGEHYFLGDLVRDYTYYLILDKIIPTHSNEKSISVKDSPRSILVGKSKSRDGVLSRIAELVSINKLAYNLHETIL
jgi:predicted ATP-grasp superfamily ATP-dependent carboligase